MYTNEEAVLLRIADVIQVNMSQQPNCAEYRLSNSAVYVQVSAEIRVKPTFLALPLFAGVEKNPVTKTNWYTINYNDIKGY